jgi:hypothetical protein
MFVNALQFVVVGMKYHAYSAAKAKVRQAAGEAEATNSLQHRHCLMQGKKKVRFARRLKYVSRACMVLKPISYSSSSEIHG